MTLPPADRTVLLTGLVAPLGRDGPPSGIDKRAVDGPRRIAADGIVGDQQADLRHHGGPEKAVHHYPFDHYPLWRAELGDLPLLRRPGAFGENLSTLGWTEANVCIGDLVRFGSAVLQVSQGRQPCFKLNHRFDKPEMAWAVQRSGRTGWYYRVIAGGLASSADRPTLIARDWPDWPLRRLWSLLYERTDDRAGLAAMAELQPLAESWRNIARNRLRTAKVEDWSRRLQGPGAGGDGRGAPSA